MRIGNSEIGKGLNGVDFIPAADSLELEQSYRQLYQDLLRQGVDVDTALDIVRDARAALSGIYHSTMIATQADPQASMRAVREKLSAVMQLARLMPMIKGDISGSAEDRGRALSRALDIVRERDMGRVKALYPWINTHVKDDDVLRAAGLNVEAVRNAGGDKDLRALLSLLRTALDLFIKTNPTPTATAAAAMTAVNTAAFVDAQRVAASTRRIRGEGRGDPTSPFGAFAFPRRF
jgi:hypothetical protein